MNFFFGWDCCYFTKLLKLIRNIQKYSNKKVFKQFILNTTLKALFRFGKLLIELKQVFQIMFCMYFVFKLLFCKYFDVCFWNTLLKVLEILFVSLINLVEIIVF